MPNESNDVKAILQAIVSGKIRLSPGVSDVEIRHDDWCNIFHGGQCNCNPSLTQNVGGSEQERVRRIVDSAAKFREVVRKKTV